MGKRKENRLVMRPKRAYLEMWGDAKGGRVHIRGSMPSDKVEQIDFDHTKWTTLIKTRELILKISKINGDVILVTRKSKIFRVEGLSEIYYDMKELVKYLQKRKKRLHIYRHKGARKLETFEI